MNELIPAWIYRDLDKCHEDVSDLVVRAHTSGSPLERDLSELLELFTHAMTGLSASRGHFTESETL